MNDSRPKIVLSHEKTPSGKDVTYIHATDPEGSSDLVDEPRCIYGVGSSNFGDACVVLGLLVWFVCFATVLIGPFFFDWPLFL